MFKSRLIPAAVAAITFVLLSTAIIAAEVSNTKRDFGTQSCKEIMRLSGDDREIALAFAHGYILGKKNTTQYDVEVLAQITDQFIDYCLDHPAENALHAFEKIAM
ncbi:MAG: hypothetical protein KDI63_13595 [Gammaproteobacteria bacterium]|nr:hypothetical protein [Gammaproteobacteria bacterium]